MKNQGLCFCDHKFKQQNIFMIINFFTSCIPIGRNDIKPHTLFLYLLYFFHRFSVNSFNEFISQNEKNKSLWDRNEVHSSEGFFKTTTSINTAGKSRCSNAVEVAENIIAAEQKHLTNTESAKSFNVNSYKEMNH